MADLIDRAKTQSELRAYLVHESSEIAQNVEQIIAALPAQGVRVKPLVWRDFDDESISVCGTYRVYVLDGRIGGIFRAIRASFGGQYLSDHRDATDPENARNAAKAAAQADYERRILAALEPAEAGGVEPCADYSNCPPNQTCDRCAGRALAHVDALVKAAEALHADMLERARTGVDAIHGEEYRIVNAGRTAWHDFDAALAAIREGRP